LKLLEKIRESSIQKRNMKKQKWGIKSKGLNKKMYFELKRSVSLAQDTIMLKMQL